MKFFITEKYADLDLIFKGKFPIGTVRDWDGQKFKKFGEGDWRPSREDKKAAPEEDKKRSLEDRLKKIQLLIENKKATVKPVKKKRIIKKEDSGEEVQLTEGNLDALFRFERYSILSSENPNLDKKQSKKLFDSLLSDVKKMGYSYSRLTAYHGNVKDIHTVIIFESERSDTKKLGEKYNQEFVIYSDSGKNEMIFTSGENKGKYCKGSGANLNAEAEDYYEIKFDGSRKLKFSLNFDFDKLYSDTKKSLYVVDLDLIFKSSLPIGTIHEWSGQKYRKFGEGDWRPVTSGKSPKQKEDPSKPQKNDRAFIVERMKKIESILADKIEAAAAEQKKIKDQKDSEEKRSFAHGTPQDRDRPNNGLGPPPPENRVFVKPGGELSVDDVQNFIEKFKSDYVELQGMGSSLKSAGASHFGNRLKDRLSLHEKMKGRLKDRSLNTVTDVIAARALANSIENQKSLIEHMTKNFDLVEIEDSSSKARPDGYRAVHVLFKTKSGKISELQIKTHRQQVFSGFTHDTIYKPTKELSNDFGKGEDGKPKNKEVAQYLNDLSEYLYGLDTGKEDIPQTRPKEPEILAKNGIKFPWKEIEKLNKKDLSDFSKQEESSKKKFNEFENKEKGKVKHFVVIRSSKKKNIEIKEFDSFEKADAFVKSNTKKHDGEMPMGYSSSKDEFLQVFSEYRPEGWDEISPELKEKVKRLGKGKGREVKLNEDEANQLLRSGKYALLSAGTNPADENDKKLDPTAVKKRYEQLKSDLVEGGYAYTPTLGRYGQVEDSFLVMVHDADKNDIEQLGEKYNQDSVIYSESGKHEMIFTTGPNKGKHHRGEGLEPDAEKKEDYYTELTLDNGKKMKFSLVFDFENLYENMKKALYVVFNKVKEAFFIRENDIKKAKIDAYQRATKKD